LRLLVKNCYDRGLLFIPPLGGAADGGGDGGGDGDGAPSWEQSIHTFLDPKATHPAAPRVKDNKQGNKRKGGPGQSHSAKRFNDHNKHSKKGNGKGPPGRIGTCFKFQKGTCDRGDGCRFSH
jgi:hypothetical protein